MCSNVKELIFCNSAQQLKHIRRHMSWSRHMMKHVQLRCLQHGHDDTPPPPALPASAPADFGKQLAWKMIESSAHGAG